MNFQPKTQLEGMRKTIQQYRDEVIRWDKPVSGFDKIQGLALGNLEVALSEVEERFNSAIKSLEGYQ